MAPLTVRRGGGQGLRAIYGGAAADRSRASRAKTAQLLVRARPAPRFNLSPPWRRDTPRSVCLSSRALWLGSRWPTHPAHRAVQVRESAARTMGQWPSSVHRGMARERPRWLDCWASARQVCCRVASLPTRQELSVY